MRAAGDDARLRRRDIAADGEDAAARDATRAERGEQALAGLRRRNVTRRSCKELHADPSFEAAQGVAQRWEKISVSERILGIPDADQPIASHRAWVDPSRGASDTSLDTCRNS